MVHDAVRRRTHPAAALLLIGLFAAAYLWLALRWPDGSWDAWAIWNLKAKLVYAGQWQALYDPAIFYSHADYPPLVPILIASGWQVTGVSWLWPVLLHGAIYLAMLWIVRRSWWAVALVGGAALLYAPMQNADVPLALCLLGACAAYTQRRETLTGLALGLGALVKNEGSLIALVFFVVWMAVERRIPHRALFMAAPFVLGLITFKHAIPVENSMVGPGGKLERLMTLSRYAIILPFTGMLLLTFGGAAIPTLGLSGLIARLRVRFTVPLLAVLGVFAGYLVFYAITPYDLVYHLTSSFDRLVMQLFPALVYSIAYQRHQA